MGYEYHPCFAWDVRNNRFVGVLHGTVISKSIPHRRLQKQLSSIHWPPWPSSCSRPSWATQKPVTRCGPEATDEPELQMFALILRCGGWMGRRTGTIGPTILMRGLLQLMATFALVNQFPDLIQSLAKNYAGDFTNAYTW